MPLDDLQGQNTHFPLYVVEVIVYLLVENIVLKMKEYLNDENLVLPSNILNQNNNELVIPTYHAIENWKRLLIVPSQTPCLASYFNGVNSLKSILRFEMRTTANVLHTSYTASRTSPCLICCIFVNKRIP